METDGESSRQLVKADRDKSFWLEDLTDEKKQRYVLKRLKNYNRLQRFATEVETIRSLNHPNIAKIIDAKLDDEKPYFVTEYCEGGELSFDKISGLSILERLNLFLAICEAIGYAHDNNIVHRDIKPSNILLKDGVSNPVVTDFGICFNTDEGFERLTETIEQVGPKFYMAPELADGRASEITAACDVYSLGKLLYWMFSGEVFDRESSNGTQKYFLSKWDLRKRKEFGTDILFVYEIFEKTIQDLPNFRYSNAVFLLHHVESTISVVKNQGRVLDSKVLNSCLFCGIGTYLVKEIGPEITADAERPGHNQTFNLNYGGLSLYNKDAFRSSIKVPSGNISNNAYETFLILSCNYCGNLQTFQTRNTPWKNINSKIR